MSIQDFEVGQYVFKCSKCDHRLRCCMMSIQEKIKEKYWKYKSLQDFVSTLASVKDLKLAHFMCGLYAGLYLYCDVTADMYKLVKDCIIEKKSA